MAVHRVDEDQVMALVEADDMVGVCVLCGAERSCTEPDARGYPCEECGESAVFGASELMLMGFACSDRDLARARAELQGD